MFKHDKKYTIRSFCLTLLLGAVLGLMISFFPLPAQAADCGGATVCACGDTVTSDYTLSADLTSCTGNGLTIGASGITINGNSRTISGTGSSGNSGTGSSGDGITIPYNNITVKNLTVTYFAKGVSLDMVTGSTIQNNTVSFSDDGIKLSGSSSNTITGNTISESSYGIHLNSSNSNTVTGNTVNSNTIGIFLEASKTNTLTSNTMSSNGGISSTDVGGNLSISHNALDKYDNTIDTTNLVEGKPVYYLYNQSNQTYDGNVVGNIGMFWCISCTNVTVKNAVLSPNNLNGVYFDTTTGSTIQNVTANSNSGAGISLNSSNSNTLTGNTTNSNGSYGISITTSNSNTVSNNMVNSNNVYGINLGGSSSNTLTGNTFLGNRNDVSNAGTTNTYSSNSFLHNITSKMLTFVDSARTKNVNDSISFDISMFTTTGTACSTCSYTITTSPAETVTSTLASNEVTGSFTATKSGTYSLMFAVTDASSNVTKRNLVFFVGATSSQVTKYYYRDTTPTHGQPIGTGRDSRTMLLTAPTGTDIWYCGAWTQNSPDELPNYPLTAISSINTFNWYKLGVSSSYIGVQRYFTYDSNIDSSSAVSSASDYTLTNKNFTGLDWAMDYPNSWYRVSVKLYGTNPYQLSSTASSSYANFTYSYTVTPVVKSISNDNVLVLSATAPSNATSTATVVVDNPTASATSTSIVIPGIQRPFTNATSTIGSDATTTLAVSVSASATSSLAAVPMDIVPSSGSITVGITTWNTTGSEQKTWTESGTVSNATSPHTISGLTAGRVYVLSIDGITSSAYTANGSGAISFTYTGGYSTHTFDLQADTTSPSVSITSPSSGATVSSTISLAASSTDNVAVQGVQFQIDGTNLGSQVTAVSSPNVYTTTWNTASLTNGAYNIKAISTDTSSNTASATITVIVSNSSAASTSGSGYTTGSGSAYSGSGGSNAIPDPFSAFSSSVATSSVATTTASFPPSVSAPPKVSLGVSGVPLFTKTLSFGSRGDEVYRLQQILGDQGFFKVAPTGYFGSLTRAALIDFQSAHEIDPIGVMGPKTRDALNRLLNSNPASSVNVSSAVSLTSDLGFGMRDQEVRSLQRMLNALGFTVAESGPGSSGQETTMFGYATKNALMRYQQTNGIEPTGYLGPVTRGRLKGGLESARR